MLRCGRFVLAVLGGTSVGTPNLIRALATARQAGRLPDLELRLYGRAHARGERIIDFACADTPLAGREPSAPIRLRLARSLAEAVRGCDAILCQVRPGGMEARAEDEAMALAEGVPGDEGLGPSGLANYLRSLPVTDALAEAWADYAPDATFLQLSSPLSLTVARIAGLTGLRVLGLCELPATTSAALLAEVEPQLGPLRHAHFGSNHWAWLYDFRDDTGADRTPEVIEAADTARLVDVDRPAVRREQAVPLHYLSLHYHRERELARQRGRAETRGAELARWADRLTDAYLAPGGPAMAAVSDLLGRRRMTWYDDGVVPALAALAGQGSADLVLNVTGVLPGDRSRAPLPGRRRHRPAPTPAAPADRTRRAVRARRGLRASRPAPATTTRDRRFGGGERPPSARARRGLRAAAGAADGGAAARRPCRVVAAGVSVLGG